MDAGSYPIEVYWSDEDGGYVAIAPDLPELSVLAVSEAEATRDIRVVINEWLQRQRSMGNDIPAPAPFWPHGKRIPVGIAQARVPRDASFN